MITSLAAAAASLVGAAIGYTAITLAAASVERAEVECKVDDLRRDLDAWGRTKEEIL